MLKTKWRFPRIDEESFLSLYDETFLRRAKEIYGLSDLWTTFSWGFSDESEREQHDFIHGRLPGVKALGIKTYGYVQGLNVVTRDHENRDFFARTAWGRRIPYSRGRDLLCPTNPETITFLEQRVREAVEAGFDAVFVDNIVAGAPPIYCASDFTSSFGCHCERCKEQFQRNNNYVLPVRPTSAKELNDVLVFRAKTITDLLTRLSKIARENGKEFGVNLYDPFTNTPELFFGYSLSAIEPLLDYHLIETFGLSRRGVLVNNEHLSALGNTKPTFVVSYRDGIGRDAMFDTATIDALLSDADARGYVPCLKASEFITHGTWHAFDFERLKAAVPRKGTPRVRTIAPLPLPQSRLLSRFFIRVVDRLTIPSATIASNYSWFQKFFESSGLYTRTLRAVRPYTVPIDAP